MKLTRRFTPLTLLMISINGMVGSAWLFAPLYAAKIAGPGAIVAWLIAGFLTALIALTFAELSVMFPVAGGSAEIPMKSHGMLTSFILSWIAWLSALTMAPIEVQAILQYASNYFTSLISIENGAHVLSGLGIFWAGILMLSFCILNVVSFRGLMQSNFLLFIFKIGVIILVMTALMKTQFHNHNFNSLWFFVSHKDGWQAILSAVATGGVAFAFTGFKHGVELAGETKQKALAIPLAIVGSILICLSIYIGLQVALIGALGAGDLSAGWRQIQFVGDAGPFAGLAAGLGLVWIAKLLYVDAAVSPAGAGLIYVTSTARILYAMSKIGYLPKWLMYVNRQKFPVAAVAVNFVIGMFLFLPLSGWRSMVSFLVSGMVISYAMGPIALLSLRLEMKDHPREFRLPCANSISLLAFYFCNLLCYWTGWDTIWKLAIAMIIGITFFCLAVMSGRIKAQDYGFKSGIWLVPYLLGIVMISYYGAFGGKNIIPFGYDFLIIAVFSFMILKLAVANRARQHEVASIDTHPLEVREAQD